jgi:drug/metabolite transporter (DMT)-like permease
MMSRGLMFAIVTALISGVSIFINGIAVTLSDPFAYTLLKNSGALLFLGAAVLALKELHAFRNLSRKQWGLLALIGLVGGSLPFLMFFWGLKLGGAAVSSFIFRSLFIFAALFGYIILKEKPEPKDYAAGLIILLGNALLVSGDLAFGMGQLMVLGATVLWALEYTISRKVLADVSPTVVMVSRMLFGSIVLFAFLGATGSLSILSSISIEGISWLGLTSLLLFGFVMGWYNALKHLPVLKASAVLASGGIITAALNLFFLGKAVTLTEAMGLVLILLGAIIMVSFSGILSAIRHEPAKLMR